MVQSRDDVDKPTARQSADVMETDAELGKMDADYRILADADDETVVRDVDEKTTANAHIPVNQSTD